jgi:hypothetical protein
LPIRRLLSRLLRVKSAGFKPWQYTCIVLLPPLNKSKVSFLAHHLFHAYTLSDCAKRQKDKNEKKKVRIDFIILN